jgi:site-specific DNA-methyltransferase (adenine-specific)
VNRESIKSIDDWINKVHCGDNCDLLGMLPRDCIDLVVTSPPYDELRTYGGDSWDFYGVAWQLKRVLKPGGVIVWVVADQTKDGSESGTSMEQALHFKRLGLNLHDTMVWNKPFIVPRPSNRYEPSFEYVFVLSKGTPKTVNLIKDKRNVGSGRKITGHKRGVEGNPEYLHGASSGKKVSEFGTRHNVWLIDADRGNKGHCHPAPFPLRLAKDHIVSWSNQGDIVLDPFVGSGTTSIAASQLGRQWIGFEINPEYVILARERIARETAQMSMFSACGQELKAMEG